MSSSIPRVDLPDIDAAPRVLVPSTFGNAAHMLLTTAVATPKQPAVVEGDQTVECGGLAARSLAIATGLQREGVEPGDRVAVLLQRGAPPPSLACSPPAPSTSQ